MRILQLSAEIFPLLKTGGLADIAGALPAALNAAGCDVRVLLPGFPAVLAGLRHVVTAGQFAAPWGENLQVRLGELPGVPGGDGPLKAYVLDVPSLFDRPGNPYEDPQRRPYPDNARRFAVLGWAAAYLAHALDRHWSPEVVHGHDWHAALACACLKLWPDPQARRVPSVYTVHNLAYQGVFDAQHLGEIGMPQAAFQMEGLEFHGQISFMKAGLFYADHITTVSPTYGREIQTPEQGCGLDGLLRVRGKNLTGILNAVDEGVWNPATDSHLPHAFDVRRLGGKAECKSALQREMGLEQMADAPLFAMVSRLTEQKGLHLVLAGVENVIQGGGQLLVLGSGDAELERAFSHSAAQCPGRVAVHLGYDEALAHRVFGASDVTLVPSRFEPCGLTQMYGLKYGSVPLVRAVGGLVDTVVDADLATLEDQSATGVVFQDFTETAYRHALRRSFALYHDRRAWARVRRAGMRQPFSWVQAARQYLTVYQDLIRP
ncbi:MAG: glycogen synthase GlgA [Rhodoferax sp.]